MYFNQSVAGHPDYKDFFIWADPLWVDPENETNRLPPSNWVRDLWVKYKKSPLE